MGGVSASLEADKLNHLIHCANNCRQMLRAIDRKLKKALDCLDQGEADHCRDMLAAVSEALPQAIAIIDHKDDGPDGQGAKGKKGQ